MKIYKIAQNIKKKPRDSNQYKTLYHASPVKLSKLKGRSVFKGVNGIYLCPTYKSLIEDWAPFVKGKKAESNAHYERLITRLENHIFRIRRDVKNLSDFKKEEAEKKMQEIEDEITELYTKKNKASPKDKKDIGDRYKTLYIHEVSCPKNVYNACLEWFFSFAKNSGSENFGFWGWGEQVFIPENMLNHLTIVGVKQLNDTEYVKEMANSRRRPEWSEGYSEYINEKWNNRNEK